MRDCILFFCKSIRRVEDVTYPCEHEISSVIVPHLSDFSAGESRWVFTVQNAAQTKVQFNATFTTKVWVPPFIGPRAIRKRTRARLRESVVNINRLLNEAVNE